MERKQNNHISEPSHIPYGGYIKERGHPEPRMANEITFSRYRHPSMDGSGIFGVPIDSNLLLALGFSKIKYHDEDVDMYSIDLPNTEDLKLQVALVNDFEAMRLLQESYDDSEVPIFNGAVNGKLFVHKIQQVYVALTGEPLEINKSYETNTN